MREAGPEVTPRLGRGNPTAGRGSPPADIIRGLSRKLQGVSKREVVGVPGSRSARVSLRTDLAPSQTLAGPCHTRAAPWTALPEEGEGARLLGRRLGRRLGDLAQRTEFALD